MKIKRPLTVFAGAFVLGEVLALLQTKVWAGIFGFLFVVVLFLWYQKERDSRGILVCLVLSFCMLGLFRGNREYQMYEKTETCVSESLTGEVVGTVQKLEEKELSWGIRLTDCRWRWENDSGEWREESLDTDVQVWLRKDLFPQQKEQLRPGRRIKAAGERTQPESPGNPGEFDYNAYYRSIGIGWQMSGKQVEPVGMSRIPWKEAVYRVRTWAEERFEQLCEPEDLGVFQAALLGEKRNLDEELRKLYQDSGIAHLLAISGLHISMIGLGIYHMLRKSGLGYGWAGVVGAVAILSYGELTGFSSSVFRAVFMLLCFMTAEYLGRSYDMLSAASLAAILLLLESPYLVFQAGFQLSFGAVAAIGGVAPWLLKQYHDISFPLKKAFLPGLAIQLVTGPVILYHFYQFPLYGIFLNLLVIPLMTYVVLSGILGLLFSCFSLEFGRMAIGSGHYILKFYTWICEWCGTLPGADLIMGKPELWQIMGYYGFLLLLGWWMLCHKRKAGRMAALGVAVISFFLWMAPLPQHGLEVTFLDVGQGDGICIQADGSVLLMDGGSSSEKEVGKNVLEPFLKSQGIKRVNYAIVSHGDQDHINGLVYLLGQKTGIVIETLVLPWLGQGDEVYENMAEKAAEHGTAVHWMKAGEKICHDKMELSCIYHGKEERKEEKNEHSLVFNLSYGTSQVILTGDMSEMGERDILEEGIWKQEGREPYLDASRRITCLKAAHHGSKYSSCTQWLEAVAPDAAVISCGEDNSYGHPHLETMERFREQKISVWQTREKGAVFFRSDGIIAEIDSMSGINH